MKPKRIGLLGFEGAMALDLIGPIDAFTSATIDESNGKPRSCYEAIIIGLSNKPFVSESGVIFKPHKTILNAPPLDTLIIPGGRGLRVPETQAKVAEWSEGGVLWRHVSCGSIMKQADGLIVCLNSGAR